MRKKGYIVDGVFSVVLFVIFVARIIFREDEFSNYIISLINSIGAELAFLSLFYSVIVVLQKEKIRNILIIIWTVALIVAVGVSTYCLLKQINFSTKIGDCITVLALLFSIPNDLYIEIVKRCVNNS